MSRLLKLLLPILLTVILSGCTPSREIKDLSIVEGMGIDAGSGESFQLTFQIFNPKSTGGGNGEKSGTSQENIIAVGNGSTIYDAIRNTTLGVGKKLYFSNTETYIVSDEICRNSFDKLIDFIERAPEVKPIERLYVAKGSASDILTAKKDGKLIPSSDLKKIAENYNLTSKIVTTTMEDIYEAQSSGMRDIVLAAVKASRDSTGNVTLTMDGTAVFRKSRLAGYLDNTQTRGLLWAFGKAKGGIVTVSPSGGGTVSLEVVGSRSSEEVIVKDGKPTIKIDVKFQSDIAEMETGRNTSLNPEWIGELTALQNTEVKSEIESAVNTCLRDFQADVFGFGLKIYEDEPEIWRKISSGWTQEMKTLPVEVNVTSDIELSGLITNRTAAAK